MAARKRDLSWRNAVCALDHLSRGLPAGSLVGM